MPIYEYECTACGYRMEVLQGIHDVPLTTCESCGEPALKKLVSASIFRLAGKGWYETDFKTGNKRNLAEKQDAGDDKKNKSKTEGGKAKSSEVKSQTETGQKAAGNGNKKPVASGRD